MKQIYVDYLTSNPPEIIRENHGFSDKFMGSRKWLIRLSSHDIRSTIRRQSLDNVFLCFYFLFQPDFETFFVFSTSLIAKSDW